MRASKFLDGVAVGIIATGMLVTALVIYRAIPTVNHASIEYYVAYQYRLDHEARSMLGIGSCQLSQHDGKKLDNIAAMNNACELIKSAFLPEAYRSNTNTQVVITYIHELKEEQP